MPSRDPAAFAPDIIPFDAENFSAGAAVVALPMGDHRTNLRVSLLLHIQAENIGAGALFRLMAVLPPAAKQAQMLVALPHFGLIIGSDKLKHPVGCLSLRLDCRLRAIMLL